MKLIDFELKPIHKNEKQRRKSYFAYIFELEKKLHFVLQIKFMPLHLVNFNLPLEGKKKKNKYISQVNIFRIKFEMH